MIRLNTFFFLKTTVIIYLLLLSNFKILAQGSDAFSTSAPDILFNPTSGDLSTATKELGCSYGALCTQAGVTTFGLNYLNHCGFTNSACTTVPTSSRQNHTDFQDLWYKVTLPTGTTQMTLYVTNLSTGNITFSLYTGTGPTATNNYTNSVTSATISAATNVGGGFFSSTKTSHLITNLTAGGTYYIRIMGAFAANNTANTCASIPHPTFTIEAQAPQANDVCANAINITTNNGGAAHTGNYTAAASENSDEWNACPITSTSTKTAAKDLWYKINYPASPSATYLTELSLTGTAGQQVRIITYKVTTACGGVATWSEVDRCDEVTLTGSADTYTVLKSDGSDYLTSVQSQARFIQIIPIGTVGNITVSANAVLANNDCAWFNRTFPGFGATSAQTANFNYATASNAYPTQAGKDLWYQFDPLSGTDNSTSVYSTTADVLVSGLSAGQEITLYLYKRHGSSGNCSSLSTDYISSTTFTSNTTKKLFCLDELHGTAATSEGYLLRVVQTAGTTATPSITVTPSAVGPFNNDCENIWTGTGPKNTGSSDAAHSYSAWHFLAGETKTGAFATATDCNSAIASSTCDGVGNTPATGEVDDKDVWFTFKVPNNQCATLGLTQSTVVSDMKFTYTANPSDGAKDAVIYIYSDCGDGNLVVCSGVLDGANTAGSGEWTATGLTQGQNYLVRVKPASTNTNFSFNFNLKIEEGVYRPCNDLRANAESLPVNNCPNYPSLVTYSAKGADDEFVPGEKDVWFTFVAPSPANGNDLWFNRDKSWVTVFLEGQSAHLITMELYLAGGLVKATGANDYTVNGVGDRTWGKFGNLEPGATYMIRLRHNQTDVTDVKYKIGVNAEGAYTPWGCGENINDGTAKLCGSCGGTNDNQSLCEEWYKIDLPPLTAPNMYWMVEVRGFDQVLDFELRSQHISEASANVGGEDDYDHPCTSRTLEPSASLVYTTAVDYQVTAGPTYTYVGGETGTESCEDIAGIAPYGGGFRRVYNNLNGPVFGQKDFYYLRVFMDPDDPQYDNCATNGSVGINTCEVIFKGPYLTQAAANAGGPPNANFCTKFDYCDLSSGVYPPVFSFYTDEDGNGRSDNGVWLGNTIDSENASWGTGAATADDSNGDDEDGLTIISQGVPGGTATFRVVGNAINAGTTVHVGMWIDWDNNGTLEDFYTSSGVTASPVNMDITVNIPASYDLSGPPVFIRLIASTTPLAYADYDKDLLNGEIEGHVFSPSQILPVELLYFKGKKLDKVNVLNWETISEMNNSHFEIERGKNGVDFEKIGKISSNNNNLNGAKYQFIDDKPVYVNNFYRLKQVDNDGSYTFSNVVQISNKRLYMEMMPNPAKDFIEVSIYNNDFNKELVIEIADMNGKTISSERIEMTSNIKKHNIRLDHIQNGIYVLKVQSENDWISNKFVIYK